MQSNKKLMRRHKDSKILGVCSGIADYLDMDVTVVRVLFILLSCLCGCIIVPYFILGFIMPSDKCNDDNHNSNCDDVK